ncbi:40S ribosomal protein S5-1 [Hordeum vulgare]|nr:40S ribosomal protein S5-1 [Hordeum vulgare]
MSEGMLHIRDVEGPKKTGSMETRLEAMEQHVFKCQGMVEHGLNANHMMITEFTNKHKMDANDIGKHLSRLYDRVDQLQGQIYDLQNQNFLDPRRRSVSKVWDSAALAELTSGPVGYAMSSMRPLQWPCSANHRTAPVQLPFIPAAMSLESKIPALCCFADVNAVLISICRK